MKSGKPLRFLALTLGGWTAVRLVMLWPVTPDLPKPQDLDVVMPKLAEGVSELTSRSGPSRGATAAGRGGEASIARLTSAPMFLGRVVKPQRSWPDKMQSVMFTTADLAVDSASGEPFQDGAARVMSPVGPELSAAAGASQPSRLRGDAWLIARPNGGDNLAFGQLGASQVGVRLVYAVDDARKVGVSARLSSPLRGRGREAALGIDWRPTALPVSLLVEQRMTLDGGAARPAAQLIGGVATRLPQRFQLEAYAQAGAVYRRGGFADGSARLTRPLLTSRVATVDLGVGGWGAVQRDVARLDVGPTLSVLLPARGGSVRFGADYRLRIAGRARPGTGPALTIGTSF